VFDEPSVCLRLSGSHPSHNIKIASPFGLAMTGANGTELMTERGGFSTPLSFTSSVRCRSCGEGLGGEVF